MRGRSASGLVGGAMVFCVACAMGPGEVISPPADFDVLLDRQPTTDTASDFATPSDLPPSPDREAGNGDDAAPMASDRYEPDGAPRDAAAMPDADAALADAVVGPGDIGSDRCARGFVECFGTCVDPLRSNEHCGACTIACPAGSSCVTGRCAVSCPAGQTTCGSVCVDTTRDPSHCGACGRSCAGSACVMGRCIDPCAGDPCGAHGWCEAGACLCDPGYAGGTCNSCDGVWVAEAGIVPTTCYPSNRIVGSDTLGDTLDGTTAPDFVQGLGGNDTLRGLDDNDYINGNMGNDFVNGNTGRDEVAGGSEADMVFGGTEDDVVLGGGGNDTINGGLGNDRYVGGDGDDTLIDADGNDRYVIDGLGNDTLDDTLGFDTARCVSGVRAISNTLVGSNRVLRLSTGGSVTILGDRVERILGCE